MPMVISVGREGAAWSVRCPDLFDNVMIHRSGARAEATARALADCLLELRLSDGSLARRFVCPGVSMSAASWAKAA